MPHIVNALLILARTLDGHSCPLAHSLIYLTLNNMLNILRDS